MSTQENAFMAPNTNSQENSKKLEVPLMSNNIQHPAYIYSIVDYGTHEVPVFLKPGQTKEQRRIGITFEFPFERHVYWEGDEPKPAHNTWQGAFSMYKSNLKALVESLLNINLTDEQAQNFDLSKLLNRPYLIKIVHNVSKKDGKTYANVESGSLLTREFMADFNRDWVFFKNNAPKPLLFQATYENFKSPIFGELKKWQQEKITQSLDARDFISQGYKFYEKPEEGAEAVSPESVDFDNMFPDPNDFM